jgi:hypothetical protein
LLLLDNQIETQTLDDVAVSNHMQQTCMVCNVTLPPSTLLHISSLQYIPVCLLIFSQAVAQITTSDRQASQAAWQLHRN